MSGTCSHLGSCRLAGHSLITVVCAAVLATLASTVALASSPTATTSPATQVTKTSATLNGSGVPNGESTTGWFRYSTAYPGTCNDTFGTRVPASGGVALGAGNSSVAYSYAVSGLPPGTPYYFCAIASNLSGTSFGAVLSFTTTGSPPMLSKTFGAASIAVGTTTPLIFTINNPNTSNVLTGIGFSDTLPSGLVVATPNALNGSCVGATITATQNTIVVSLSGATLVPSDGCTFAVNVAATGTGNKINTTSAITSNEGGTGAAATAALTINKSSTTTTLTTACMTTFVANQSFTMTTTVSGYSPMGNSSFLDGGSGISGCTSLALSNGTATCVTSALPAGVHTLTAAYGGDVNNSSSNSTSLFATVLDPTDAVFRNGFETPIAGCPNH